MGCIKFILKMLLNVRSGYNLIIFWSPVQMYRITVRTSNEAISRKICDILSEQF